MPFITDADLRSAVASAMGEDAADLVSKWDEIIPAANQMAYGMIVSELAAKSFSPAQVAGWDFGAAYQRRIGLYFCGKDGAFLTNYAATWVQLYADDIKELKALKGIVVGNRLVFPAAVTADGQGFAVVGGQMTGSSVPRRDWTQEF